MNCFKKMGVYILSIFVFFPLLGVAQPKPGVSQKQVEEWYKNLSEKEKKEIKELLEEDDSKKKSTIRTPPSDETQTEKYSRHLYNLKTKLEAIDFEVMYPVNDDDIHGYWMKNKTIEILIQYETGRFLHSDAHIEKIILKNNSQDMYLCIQSKWETIRSAFQYEIYYVSKRVPYRPTSAETIHSHIQREYVSGYIKNINGYSQFADYVHYLFVEFK